MTEHREWQHKTALQYIERVRAETSSFPMPEQQLAAKAAEYVGTPPQPDHRMDAGCEMKALTIWQPWASLIMAGAKPYEFRGWRAPRSLIGQRIVIHAAARQIDKAEANNLYHILMMRETCDTLAQAAAETCLLPEPALPILGRAWWPHREHLPLAAGLGTAILGEPRIGTEIAEEFGVPRANDSDRDEHANWGWPLTDIEIWDEPIPMKGRQGLWNWPEPKDFGL